MAIRLLGNRVMVKRAEAETTSGGIHLPEAAQQQPQRAEVVAVGEGEQLPDGTLIAPDVDEGDSVIIAQYGGTEISMDGEDYLIMDADMILAREA
jgi:chaperonin GroES